MPPPSGSSPHEDGATDLGALARARVGLPQQSLRGRGRRARLVKWAAGIAVAAMILVGLDPVVALAMPSDSAASDTDEAFESGTPDHDVDVSSARAEGGLQDGEPVQATTPARLPRPMPPDDSFSQYSLEPPL